MSDTQAAERVTIGLVLTFLPAEVGGYRHILAGPVLLGRVPWDYDREGITPDTIRNPGSELCNGWALDGLRVSCQMDRTTARAYAWTVDYRECFCVGRERAEGMADTLKRLDRKLERAQTVDGWPADFAAYLVRVGRALGVSTYLVKRGTARDGWSYADVDWRRMTAADAVSQVRAWEGEHAESVQVRVA